MDHNVNVNRENAKRLDRCSGLALSLVLTELSSPGSTMVQHEYGYDWFFAEGEPREKRRGILREPNWHNLGGKFKQYLFDFGGPSSTEAS